MVALSLGAAWIGTRDSVMHMITVTPFRPSSASDLASLRGATAWLNSEPLTAAALQGKVVLIDFWTYTCINWLRTVPYVRAWAARYKEQGLVVIGVHTPEFSFEEDIDNVRKAAQERGVTYPIAIDNNRAIWSGFGNHYWPALYFIDASGRVRDHHFGEGNYEESESEWTVKTEAAVLDAAGGRIAYRFHARDLHLVMRRGERQGPVPFRVLVDGQPPGAGHGSDLDEHGNGAIEEPRLYQPVRQSAPVSDRQLVVSR